MLLTGPVVIQTNIGTNLMGIANQVTSVESAPLYERKLISDLPQFVRNTLTKTQQHDAMAYTWAKMPASFRWQCMAVAFRQSPSDFGGTDHTGEWYDYSQNQKNILRRVVVQTLDAALDAFARTEVAGSALPDLVQAVKAEAAA